MARHGHARSTLDAERGWSLIELLAATTLFLVALLAAAPLFMRAVHDVRTGAVRSAASILAQNGLEAWRPPPGGSPAAPVARREYYSFAQRRWLAVPPAPPDRALWVRETSVRRYPLDAITDGRVEVAEAAPGGGRGRGGPRLGLLGIEVKVSRPAGERPVAGLERLEWTRD